MLATDLIAPGCGLGICGAATTIRRSVAKHLPTRSLSGLGLVQQTIQDYSVYPMPIGSAGVAMIDTRDIADIAVAELLRRDRSTTALERVTLELVGPQALTGAGVAKLWSSALGREIAYGGDDVAAFETQLAAYGPAWLAYDMRLMMEGIQAFGMQAAAGAVARLEAIIGRPLRTYQGFVSESVTKTTA